MNQIFLYYFIKKDKKLNQLRGCPGSSCGTTVENTPRGREDVSSNHAGSGAFYNPTLSPFSGASLSRSLRRGAAPLIFLSTMLKQLEAKQALIWAEQKRPLRLSKLESSARKSDDSQFPGIRAEMRPVCISIHSKSISIQKKKKCSAEKSVFPTKEKFFRVHEDFFKNSLF